MKMPIKDTQQRQALINNLLRKSHAITEVEREVLIDNLIEERKFLDQLLDEREAKESCIHLDTLWLKATFPDEKHIIDRDDEYFGFKRQYEKIANEKKPLYERLRSVEQILNYWSPGIDVGKLTYLDKPTSQCSFTAVLFKKPLPILQESKKVNEGEKTDHKPAPKC